MKHRSHPTEAVPDPLHDKKVVLCVTGGIAAYKSAYLTRALVKAGARVIVVMTEAAQRFVAPLTFETLSGNPVVTSTFDRAFQMGAVEHIDLATWADVVVVAPATYNFLGKLHAGIADDAVTTFVTAVVAPIYIAPAMNDHMWRNPICRRNVEALRDLGYAFIDPQRGGLACSWEGEGRMSEPEEIVEALRTGLQHATGDAETAQSEAAGDAVGAEPGTTREGGMAGRTLLVTAAGTWEALDPVRFVGNRSSGRMGYALAAAARRRGAHVFLVSGPTALTPPEGLASTRRVESAEQMLQACRDWIDAADVLVMAAAVADYRPRQVAASKIKRTRQPLKLELEPTPDILSELESAKGTRLFVGFALETEDPQRAGERKLAQKGLDLLVANRVGPETGPERDTNQVWIYNASGLVEATPVLEKRVIAEIILDAIESELLERRQHAAT
jgi:phosphopantothenoylcysteine decarboxylase/phosphopantothenate--cysteine ligase